MPTVYPAPDRFIVGVPTVPLDVDAATAARLVASGAFVTEGKGKGEPLTAEARAALDYYQPQQQTED